MHESGGGRVTIRYGLEPQLSADEFIDVLRRSTLAERRPIDDRPRIERMLRHSDLIVTARDADGRLIGVSRAVSDFGYCVYVSDLAVAADCQGGGIGKQLLDRTHEAAGPGTTLILIAAPKARSYYPHIGMDQHDSCWIVRG